MREREWERTNKKVRGRKIGGREQRKNKKERAQEKERE